MTLLLTGIVIFLGTHLVPYTPLKPTLKQAVGEGAYKGAFSLLSLLGLALMIWGFWGTRSGPEAANFYYYPADWTRHAAMLLVLLAFVSLMAAFHKGRLKLWLRNPMSIGFALWAIAHLLANGKVASVWFFGTFLALALLDIAVSEARGKVPRYVPKPSHDLIAAGAGILLYAVFLWGFHPYVLNLPIV